MNPYENFYDDETLKHLQHCELEILDDFLALCEREGLSYFAWGGTGIGALRHKGFIPWDDDIDIALPSSDLERLIEIVNEEYKDKYIMMYAGYNINYPLPTVRMMLKGTKFREPSLLSADCELGIFLDLYGFDSVPDGAIAYYRQAFGAWFWSHLRLLKNVSDPIILQKGIAGAIIRRVCSLASKILMLPMFSSEKMYARELSYRNRYRNKKTRRIAWLCDTSPFSSTYLQEEVFPLKVLEFEGRALCFPRCIEQQLTEFYGDYMTMPPADARKTHFPAQLDFGEY